MTTPCPTVWIYQPYVPVYRRPFFEGLAQHLRAQGVRLRVRFPDPPLAHSRGDRAAPASWSEPVPARRVRVAGRTVHLSSARGVRPGDAVITGLQATSLDSWRALTRRRVARGLWGHVGSYVARPHPTDLALERWMMRRADRVFAYTEDGAALARRAGARAVTTVMNSVDVSYLDGPRAALPAAAARAHREGRPLVAFLGALDATKRLDLLAAALEVLASQGSDLHVLVAGEGPDAARLRPAIARSQVSLLGYADGPVKAAVADTCGALVVPGRIGLVAVEALAMGRPIVTTSTARHAPEAAYLTPGASLIAADPDPASLAAAMSEAARRPRQQWAHPDLGGMVGRMGEGIVAMLADAAR